MKIFYKLSQFFFIASLSSISFLAFSQISGKVFVDANGNGTADTGESGYGGITVTAYDASNAVASTTTTATTPVASIGNYTLSGLTSGQPYRVEFQTPTGLFSTGGTTTGKTSVVFVNGGDTNVNYGIYDPTKATTETDPRIVAGCGSINASTFSVASWRYLTQRKSTSYYLQVDPHSDDILNTQVGVPFYLDVKWDGTRNLVFMTPIASKFFALPAAPNGDDAIYVADYSNKAAGYAYQSYKLLVDLGTLGINVTPQIPVTTAANAETGEYGLGGIAVSPDGKSLYVVNLGKGNIIKLDISGVNYASLPATAPTSFTEIAIPTSVTNATGGIFRPLSLKKYRGDIYVGGVCDASTGGTDANLRLKILKMDVATQTFTEVFVINPTQFTGGASLTPSQIGWPNVRWKSTFGNEIQPFLNDFGFDDNGSLIIGVTNRKIYTPSSSLDFGYVLRTSRNTDGTFTLENAGVAGPYTTSNTLANTGTDGPGSKWFFRQGLDPNTDGADHGYGFIGGIYIQPGTNEVLQGYTNPLWSTTMGARYSSLSTGLPKFGISLVGQKAFAMTGMNTVFDTNPIEIGNRVWTDTNSNGIQDANELGISGITVTLCNAAGTSIATTTTDGNGNYFFSSTTTAALTYNTTYILKFPLTSGTKTLTSQNTGANDLIDSDAGTDGKITFTTGNAGENNHSYDVGYKTNTITVVTCPGPYGGTGAIGDPAQWVVIGDPGNPADGPAYSTMVNGSPVVHNDPNQVGRGSVNYVYSIADGFVTIKDYLRFLNAVDPTNTLNYEGSLVTYGLVFYNGSTWVAGSSYCTGISAADIEKVAVTSISLNQKARFANWVATGNVNTGAYTFESADGNANITAIDNAFTGVRLLTENEYYKAAFWDQANNTYNLYGTTGLQANGTPIVSGVAANGIQTDPLGVVYSLTSPDPNICWPQVQSGQGGRSAYGVSNMAGGFHNSMLPDSPTFPIVNDILRPDNLAALEGGQRSSFRRNDIPANGFFPSPSFQLARTGNACLCEVVVVTAEPTPCNTSDNSYALNGWVTFPTAPPTGTLTISVPGGVPTVFSPPFMSPTYYTISLGLNSDGASHTVTATFSSSANCEGTKTYTAPPSCICVTPTATAAATQPACTGTNAPNNGGITITGGTGLRYQYSSGATFNSGAAIPASITAIPAGGVITSTLSNTTSSYTVRIYNATDDACFVDRVVNITAVVCNTCTPPNAGSDVTMCLPKTVLNLTDAPSGTQWVAVAGNPAVATINPTTGEITGLTATGTYTFSLQTIADATCKDDMQVTVTNGDVPIVLCNDGSTSYTLTAPANLTNVIWYNMAGQQVGTGNTLVVTSNLNGLSDGTEAFYYHGIDSAASGCDVELCCPVKFLTQSCCPVPNCGTITVIKN